MLKPLSTLAAGLLLAASAWALPSIEIQTSQGKITLELNPEKAPKTVEMFLYNAKHGFYEATIFHRVIDGFMIQGGGFTADMVQKPINLKDNSFLNHRAPNEQGYGYTVFGKVIQGMEVVDKIAKVPTGNHGMYENVPQTPVSIQAVKILSEK